MDDFFLIIVVVVEKVSDFPFKTKIFMSLRGTKDALKNFDNL